MADSTGRRRSKVQKVDSAAATPQLVKITIMTFSIAEKRIWFAMCIKNNLNFRNTFKLNLI
jgi:hypothetical protein